MRLRSRAYALVLFVALVFLLLIPLRSATGQDLPDGVAPASPDAVDAVQGSSFNYQGQLRRSGSLYTGTCAMRFSLWNALSGGSQIGSTLTFSSLSVASGSFNVALDFGGGAFVGYARWLQTAVKCGADAAYTTLAPRQSIASTPYAIALRPRAVMRDGLSGDSIYVEKNAANSNAIHGKGLASGSIGVWGEGVNNTGVYGLSSGGVGVWGKSTASYGLYGESGYVGIRGVGGSYDGVQGVAASAGGVGVYGYNSAGTGIYGVSGGGGYGVSGSASSSGGRGVNGVAYGQYSIGVYGESNSAGAVGVYGKSTNSTAVYGQSTYGRGVWGVSDGYTAVNGTSNTGIGVWGISNTNGGVWGESGLVGVQGGVSGSTAGRVAVRGDDNGADKSTGFAGYFVGRVAVNGKFITSLAATTIDDPRDPANKTLSHAFMESPDMVNVYSGNVTTDANGDAAVTLPGYFDAINQDPRYQLTVVGQFAQAIVAEKIQGNQFKIKTDKPNVEVSWQVTGVRKDPYAAANRIVAEQDKAAFERGRFYYPAGYGQPDAMSVSAMVGASAFDPAVKSDVPVIQQESVPLRPQDTTIVPEVQP